MAPLTLLSAAQPRLIGRFSRRRVGVRIVHTSGSEVKGLLTPKHLVHQAGFQKVQLQLVIALYIRGFAFADFVRL